MGSREGGLVAWQWALYADGHRDRRNLLIHILTVPVFLMGTCLALLSPWIGWVYLPAGLVAMVLVMAVQGTTHKMEATKPVPFLGPADVLGRILVEQWFTFPRFVLSGGWLRAWRAAKR